jgi:hypothetical protein
VLDRRSVTKKKAIQLTLFSVHRAGAFTVAEDGCGIAG